MTKLPLVVVDPISSLASHTMRYGAGVWKTMRPTDWIKNLFVFAPLFFSGLAANPVHVLQAIHVFISFSAMASAIYTLNDVYDRDRDRLHPTKCLRPVASGLLPVKIAIAAACVLAAFSVLLVVNSLPTLGMVASYGLLNTLYTARLKHIVIVDVCSIALGFVLRVFAGGFIIGVEPSAWLILATFLLSLFLGLAKRRHELATMQKAAESHRPSLDQYSVKLIDELIAVVTPATLFTYILYTLDMSTIARFHSNKLYFTSLFVVLGIFRYLYLIHMKSEGGSPTQLVVKDVPLLTAIVLWLVTFAGIVYLGR